MTEQTTGPVVATEWYRDVSGALHRVALLPGAAVSLRGSLLSARTVTRQDDGEELLQKWVPEKLGRLRPEAYERLDAEIRACAAFGQRFGGPHYPAELPELVGYNVDVAEPFVLLKTYRGDPVPRRRMELPVVRDFAGGLLRALQHAADAGVVHGAVTHNVVRWDGDARAVQLVDFERAQRPGDRRRAGGGPERSPEQVAGVGAADPRDDVWGAGLLVHQLSLGPNADGVPAPAPVQTLLDHVFVEKAADRPTAAQVLLRLDPHAVAPDGSSPDQQLADGWSAFDQVLARKRRALHPPEADTPPAPDRVPSDGGPLSGVSRATLVLVIVIVAVIVVGIVLLVTQ